MIAQDRRGVAQLVAHLLWEQGVVSSSLAAPTSLFTRAEERVTAIVVMPLCSHNEHAKRPLSPTLYTNRRHFLHADLITTTRDPMDELAAGRESSVGR